MRPSMRISWPQYPLPPPIAGQNDGTWVVTRRPHITQSTVVGVDLGLGLKRGWDTRRCCLPKEGMSHRASTQWREAFRHRTCLRRQLLMCAFNPCLIWGFVCWGFFVFGVTK